MHKYDNELRQKMSSMEAVPTGFQFDAARTWQKMEDQLQLPTKKNKRIAWIYWAAASVVLVTAGFILFGSNGYPPKQVITETIKESKEQLTTPIIPTATVTANDENTVKSNNKERKSVAVAISKNPSPTIIAKPEQIVFTEPVIKETSNIIVQANSIKIDTSTNNTAPVRPIIATAKKARLKVVHINELDAPPPPVIAKLDNKKQLLEQAESNALDNEPSKPFWQKKPKQASAISLTDNQ